MQCVFSLVMDIQINYWDLLQNIIFHFYERIFWSFIVKQIGFIITNKEDCLILVLGKKGCWKWDCAENWSLQ